MRYNCLIIDDNEIERDLIESYLVKFSQLNIVAACANGFEALEILKDNKIHLVFSDIDMPDISGIELFRNLNTPPVFIFVTAYVEHALESFELDALDFIAKPVSMERLLKAVNKATDYLGLKNKTVNSNTLESPVSGNDIFFIKETKGYTRLSFDEVVYVESLGDFSKLFTTNDVHVTLINLKNLEQQLPTHYFRVHKQYIVNFNKIITANSYEITLESDFKIPLSPSYRDKVMLLIAEKALTRSAKK